MNKFLYRVIFNFSCGQLMVVAENTSRQSGSGDTADTPSPSAALRFPMARLTGIAFAALIMVGAVMKVLPVAQAQIVADPNAPRAQQPVIVNTANGLPQVNIQTPSAAGVSRNTYTQFDVQKQGAILNNSRVDVQTQLGGWVQRNPNLANGTARVILNEINSSNPSYLRGFVEVAGDRAQVIVANPSGVTCDGCGFINANRTTLTTGTAIMNGGSLDGYLVRGGSVIVQGAGLDASQSDYTDIIARAVQINAGIWSKELRVTAGANQVNADNTQAARISPAAADPIPVFGVDVAQLGGMYANKIILIGNEAGVGMRNAGKIGAAAGEIIITADGRLENSGAITAQDKLTLNAGSLANSGNGVINSQADVSVTLQGDFQQTANASLSADRDLSLRAAGSLTNAGKLGAAGELTLSGRQMDNQAGAAIKAQDIHLQASANLRNAGEISAKNLLDASADSLDNTGALIGGDLNARMQTLNNTGSGALLGAARSSTLSAAQINNQAGAVIRASDITLKASTNLRNAGEINASNLLDITAGTFDNTGIAIGTDLIARAQTLNNSGSNALLGSGNSMSLWIGNTLNNTGNAMIYSAGDMAIAADSVRDANGLVNRTMQINNEDSTIEAANNLEIAAVSIKNSRSGVSVANVTTVDEQRSMAMASWWHNGPNDPYYNPNSANFSPHEFYYVNPADILQISQLVTPDGNTIGRAVIRTHANDSVFYQDSSGSWGEYGTIQRLGASDGTRVIYFTGSSSGVSNPDQVAGGDIPSNLTRPINWSALPAYSNQYGSCTTNCIRFMTQPGYDDPNSVIIRDTQRQLGGNADGLEVRRDAHHVAVEDRLAAGAGKAAEIRSGGNMHIAISQVLDNQYSNIVADGKLLLDGSGADVSNLGQTLYRRHSFDGIWYTANGTAIQYAMPSISEIIGTTKGAIVGTQGLTIVARNFTNTDAAAGGAANIRDSVTLTTGSGQAMDTVIGNAVTRPGGNPVPVSIGGLFQQASSGNYLIETRSQFANQRTWLSSDYLLSAMNVDPATTQKRLGDGFYEQRLVREQMAQLTGRVIGGANDDSQYQQLLNSAVSYAQAWDLRPGVALTADQISHLTSDIVWLESQTVSLPDGTTQDVLVPKVYLAHVDSDALKSSGALVSGSSVTIQADNITNKGGLIDGRSANGNGRTILVASNDLNNLGGGIRGDEIVLSAGGDIRNETLTVTERYSNAQNNGTFTSLSNQATISADSKLTINAGRDVTDVGGVISAGAGAAQGTGTIDITAGRDIILTTAKTGSTYNAQIDGYVVQSGTISNQGSQLSSGSDMSLTAQRDIALTGANVNIGANGSGSGTVLAGRDVQIVAAIDESISDQHKNESRSNFQENSQSQSVVGSNLVAKDGLSISAGALEKASLNIIGSSVAAGKNLGMSSSGDVNILAAQEGSSTSIYTHSSSSGFLSSRSNTDFESRSYTNSVGSNISGDKVNITSGHDIGMQGSSVVSVSGTSLDAANNISLSAATNTFAESSMHEQKRSGIFGGGGLGIQIGSSSRKESYDGVSVTESQSRSALGAINGNVSITAGKDVSIRGSDVIAGKAADGTGGDISVTAQNISIDPARDSADSKQAIEARQSGIGIRLVGTPYDTVKNINAVAGGNGSQAQKGKGILDELGASALSVPQLAVSIGSSSSNYQATVSSLANQGSNFTAAGDLKLTATGSGAVDANGKAVDGNINVSGSNLSAGGAAILNAMRDINILAATNQIQQNNSASSSSSGINFATPDWGTLIRSLTGGPNQGGTTLSPVSFSHSTDNGTSTINTQVGSNINADRVVINSRTGDINVGGSSVYGNNDVSLLAQQGRINVNSGENTSDQHEDHNSTAFGSLGSSNNGTATSVGYRTTSDTIDSNQQLQNPIRSQISSGNGNLTLDAKQDISVQGSDLSAGNDITLIGQNVNLDAGTDASQQRETHNSSQVGVTMSVGGIAGQITQAANAALAAQAKGDNRLAALYGAQAGVIAATAAKGITTDGTSTPQLIKVTVALGSSSSESQSNSQATQQRGSTLAAGNSMTIVATGNGQTDAQGKAVDGDINMVGTQVSGKDVNLVAARDVNAISATDTTNNRSSSNSSGVSIGVGVAFGGDQNGLTLELGATKTNAIANGESTVNHNTHITASDTLSITTGRDANLAGAQLRGDTVTADVGRNLNIVSQQDSDTYHSQQNSEGIGVSLCIPPFCLGNTVSASGSAESGNIDSTYKSVNEQSGIYAGNGGYNIHVNDNTDLKGSVIASSATADKNTLTTGTLTTSDIENKAEYSASNGGASLSLTTGKVGVAQNVLNNVVSNAAANSQNPQEGNAESTTKSAISNGAIAIIDTAGQQQKTGQTAEQTIANINHDTANASAPIGKIFDLQKIQRDQEVGKATSQLAQQIAPLLYEKVGDWLQTNDADTSTKVAVHALIGGLMTKAMGGEFGTGAAGAAAAELAVQMFGKDILGMEDISPEDKAALVQLLGLVVAKATTQLAGGTATDGNAAGLTAKLSTEFNYLRHQERKDLNKAKSDCYAKRDKDSCGTAAALQKKDEASNRALEQSIAACEGESCNKVAQFIKDEMAKLGCAIPNLCSDNDTLQAYWEAAQAKAQGLSPVYVEAWLLDAKAAYDVSKIAFNVVRALGPGATELAIAEAIVKATTDAAKSNNFYRDGVELPQALKASTGKAIQANPDKTTTVLGTWIDDTNNIINQQIGIPKNMGYLDPKVGGFNLLNTPDELYAALGPTQFWEQVNRPFLDAAIRRGDDIVLATNPTSYVLVKNGVQTGFGKEYQYLVTNGYRYDAATGYMIKK